jgi:hypothetical protein
MATTANTANDKICVIHDRERAEALASNATVYCGQCGAEARDPSVVCHPVQFTTQNGKKW